MVYYMVNQESSANKPQRAKPFTFFTPKTPCPSLPHAYLHLLHFFACFIAFKTRLNLNGCVLYLRIVKINVNFFLFLGTSSSRGVFGWSLFSFCFSLWNCSLLLFIDVFSGKIRIKYITTVSTKRT